jgi:hypothetical protein
MSQLRRVERQVPRWMVTEMLTCPLGPLPAPIPILQLAVVLPGTDFSQLLPDIKLALFPSSWPNTADTIAVSFFFFFFFFLITFGSVSWFWDWVSWCSPVWPGTCFVDQADLEAIFLPLPVKYWMHNCTQPFFSLIILLITLNYSYHWTRSSQFKFPEQILSPPRRFIVMTTKGDQRSNHSHALDSQETDLV